MEGIESDDLLFLSKMFGLVGICLLVITPTKASNCIRPPSEEFSGFFSKKMARDRHHRPLLPLKPQENHLTTMVNIL